MKQKLFELGIALHDKVTRFGKDEEGASAIEYAIIAGLIAVGIIVAATALGTDISNLFDHIGEKLPGGA